MPYAHTALMHDENGHEVIAMSPDEFQRLKDRDARQLEELQRLRAEIKKTRPVYDRVIAAKGKAFGCLAEENARQRARVERLKILGLATGLAVGIVLLCIL
jgi:hypothetical protein